MYRNVYSEKVMDQYQHIIPRFILRHFAWTEEKQPAYYPKSNRDYIYVYPLHDGGLKELKVSKAYAQLNFYTHKDREISPHRLSHYVEKKLAELEGTAAKIIYQLSEVPRRGSTEFTLDQNDYNELLKFLFVMYYRTGTSRETFKDKDSEFAKWFARVHGGSKRYTFGDVWMRGLKYYLSTPHEEILHTAQSEEHADNGKPDPQPVPPTRANGNLDFCINWYARLYYNYTHQNTLGIWKAEANSEFILADNGFGTWEGITDKQSCIHRISVVTPQIALVLRAKETCRAPETSGQDRRTSTNSCLLGISLEPPQTQGRLGQMKMPVTPLSQAETQLVNNIILTNVTAPTNPGYITFANRKLMLVTQLHNWDTEYVLPICGQADLLDDIPNSPDLVWLAQSLLEANHLDPPIDDSNLKTGACLFVLVTLILLFVLYYLWRSGFL
ncbi:hypothetical protein AX16_010226 [Volvariella volvacea WC 439]|nr:hypothetical protein AX16_010226 [Volvariella volvacea WC 439]